MSVTLSDAQHLCWKSFRKISDLLNRKLGQVWTPSVAAKELLEKAGEMAEIVKSLEASEAVGKPETKEMLARGFSDLLYMIFVLAEHYDIDLDETFVQSVNDRIMSMLE